MKARVSALSCGVVVRPRVNSEGRRAGDIREEPSGLCPMAPLFCSSHFSPRSLCAPLPSPYCSALSPACNPCLSLLESPCPSDNAKRGHLSLRCPSLVGTCLKDGTSLEMRPWPPVTTLTIASLPCCPCLSPAPPSACHPACLLSCLGFPVAPCLLYHSIFAGACLSVTLPWTRVFFFPGLFPNFPRSLLLLSSCFSSILLSPPPAGVCLLNLCFPASPVPLPGAPLACECARPRASVQHTSSAAFTTAA